MNPSNNMVRKNKWKKQTKKALIVHLFLEGQSVALRVSLVGVNDLDVKCPT